MYADGVKMVGCLSYPQILLISLQNFFFFFGVIIPIIVHAVLYASDN